MEWVLFSLVIIWLAYRAIKANFEDRVREANDELQEYYESQTRNSDADNKLRNPERVQHVQDKFNR